MAFFDREAWRPAQEMRAVCEHMRVSPQGDAEIGFRVSNAAKTHLSAATITHGSKPYQWLPPGQPP
jgi:hypothetical protein